MAEETTPLSYGLEALRQDLLNLSRSLGTPRSVPWRGFEVLAKQRLKETRISPERAVEIFKLRKYAREVGQGETREVIFLDKIPTLDRIGQAAYPLPNKTHSVHWLAAHILQGVRNLDPDVHLAVPPPDWQRTLRQVAATTPRPQATPQPKPAPPPPPPPPRPSPTQKVEARERVVAATEWSGLDAHLPPSRGVDKRARSLRKVSAPNPTKKKFSLYEENGCTLKPDFANAVVNLQVLEERVGEPIDARRQRDLFRKMFLGVGTITVLVTELERAGFLKSERADKQRKVYTLTDKARQYILEHGLVPSLDHHVFEILRFRTYRNA